MVLALLVILGVPGIVLFLIWRWRPSTPDKAENEVAAPAHEPSEKSASSPPASKSPPVVAVSPPVSAAKRAKPSEEEEAHESAAFKTRLQGKWNEIAFLDVETTGLHSRDRIVTLAVILFHVPSLDAGKVKCDYIHRIYNPGINCHPEAAAIHGHTDWTLRHQPFFAEEAKEIKEFLSEADLIVAHNAQFDLRFLEREFARVAMPSVNAPSFCTMEHYRSRHDGSASLKNVARQLGLKRQGQNHGALEDAWLALNVFFYLQGTPLRFPFSNFGKESLAFQNFRPVPPMPDGKLPARKRAPKVKQQPGL
jgi:DNA polymerase-3 subunit epsilon